MKLSKFTKFATVSAFALGVAFSIGSAQADPAGDNVPMPMTATALVATAFDLEVTPLDFGTLSISGDVADTASATLTPDIPGVFTDDTVGPALITDILGNQVAATVVATQLPNNAAVTVTYAGVSGLINGADTLELDILDNLDAPTVGVAGTAGSVIAGVVTPGTATADGTGNLSFEIGGTITTVAGGTYAQGTYTDSFTMAIDF